MSVTTLLSKSTAILKENETSVGSEAEGVRL